jgi:hypothetical protein
MCMYVCIYTYVIPRFPLTAESIFTRTRNLNHKGENDYGGKGEIAIVDSDGNKTKIIHNIIN